MTSVYPINKNINKSIEFKGFRAQYITYLAIGLVLLLLLFAIGYMVGIPAFILVMAIGAAAFGLFSWVYRLSHRYGEHGLMKEGAYRRLPKAIICRSRKTFLSINTQGGGQ